MINPQIFREYDIRGVYQKDYDESFAEKLGFYYVRFLQSELGKKEIRLSVGYDARLSSPSLCHALCSGIQKAGGFIYLLDMITSPLSYFSCFHLDIDGAIMITGSHNPPDHNGFKISKGKTTIHSGEISALKNLILSDIEDLRSLSVAGGIKSYNIINDYVEKYTQEFKGKLDEVSVCFDCGNAAAGVVVPQIFKNLQLKGEVLFAEPDGRFPNHHPDPSVEKNLTDLKKAVLTHKYSIGVGFDGDADRIGVVDNEGRMVTVDQFMILFAQDILKSHPGAPIIGDVKCSQIYYDKIREFGGQPIMWKTGHSLIKEKVRAEKAPFGGELSGHVFFADRNYGYDDAFYASLRLLEIINLNKLDLATYVDQLPKCFSTPELRVAVKEEEKFLIVEKLKQQLSQMQKLSPDIELLELNTLDGVRANITGGWALVRASNTQPAITVRFENSNATLLEHSKNIFSELLNLDLIDQH